MAKCIEMRHTGESCEFALQNGKPIRRIPVRTDILDASGLLKGPIRMPVFVTVGLAEWFKRLGDDQALEKLQRAVNLGVFAMMRNGGDQKSNFFTSPVPAEYLTVERYYVGRKPGLLIDYVPIQNAEMLYGEW